MTGLEEDTLRLKAAIEFGSEYIYTIRNGGLGPTLFVDVETAERAHKARKELPSEWEGLRVIVIYCKAPPEESLYDPNLT